jgi:glyoxylase-like metal-dependent hydrolase (beta-lactamase superfamily II)
MSLPKIENLQITRVTENILHIHQIKTPFYFSCCDGLLILPKEGRNGLTIVLDVNIEPRHINALYEQFGPISTYVCTHGHMDHITHVHAWEDLGAKIYGPEPELRTLLDLRHFYKMYRWEEGVDYELIEEFATINKYEKCKKAIPFNPGDKLTFEEFEVESIPFLGHSVSHVGFFLQKEKILHISCLGFDQPKPGIDGFGPWYGFKQCSISQYLDDIDKAEFIFREGAKFLTSSHSYIAKKSDKAPFEYMRRKIKQNQQKVDIALANLKPTPNFEKKIEKLLKKDLFFPKKKMRGFIKKIYEFWEREILTKHVQKSEMLSY